MGPVVCLLVETFAGSGKVGEVVVFGGFVGGAGVVAVEVVDVFVGEVGGVEAGGDVLEDFGR